MSWVNFKVDVDADGIALITWDSPGRSMNVFTLEATNELGQIIEKVATDPAIKGAVVTSGKEAFSGGADLTMLENLSRTFADTVKAKGQVEANRMVFDEFAQDVAELPPPGDLGQAVGRGDQRHLRGRRVRAGACVPSPDRIGKRKDARGSARD